MKKDKSSRTRKQVKWRKFHAKQNRRKKAKEESEKRLAIWRKEQDKSQLGQEIDLTNHGQVVKNTNTTSQVQLKQPETEADTECEVRRKLALQSMEEQKQSQNEQEKEEELISLLDDNESMSMWIS